MTGRLTVVFLLVLGTLGMWPGAVGAARPETVELKGSGRSLGQLPRVVVDDGGAYVPVAGGLEVRQEREPETAKIGRAHV